MYEVIYTTLEGQDHILPYDDLNKARTAFDDIKDGIMEGVPEVDTVGCYYVDGDGAEKELMVWAR